MSTRILLTAAGTGPANNLVRSLRAGDASLVVVGCHTNRFVLTQSTADRNYLITATSAPDLARVVRKEKIDLVIPTRDDDVRVLARDRDRLGARTFLPRASIVNLCGDKFRLTEALRRRGVAVPRTVPVSGLAGVTRAFRALKPKGMAWCRARRGSGSLGALPVRRPEQARAWIAYWREMRGVPASSFTLSEYLPGRDFGCQTLWKHGEVVLAKAFERLEYFVGGGQPSGVSSVAALGRTTSDPRPVATALEAVRAIDRRATGLYSVDMKENAAGTPCVSEINAGRFLAGTNILDLAGKHNMALTYVLLALDEPVVVGEPVDPVDGHYMVRDLDVLPGILHMDALFDDVVDLRRSPRAVHP
jgi:carbamoyl-phosphate synthase large subunit